MSIFSVSISGQLENGHSSELIISIEHESEDNAYLNITQEDSPIRIKLSDLIDTLKVFGCIKEV